MFDLELAEKLEKAIQKIIDSGFEKAYCVLPYFILKEIPLEEWFSYSKEKGIDIYFIKNAYTKKEKRYLLNDKGELELL